MKKDVSHEKDTKSKRKDEKKEKRKRRKHKPTALSEPTKRVLKFLLELTASIVIAVITELVIKILIG